MAIRAFIQGGGTGLQWQLARLLPHLTTRGIDATVLAGGTRGFPRRDHTDGTEIRRSLMPGYSPLAAADYVGSSILHLTRRRSRVDVVHAHGAIHPGSVALGAIRLGIPAVITLTRTGSRSDFSDLLERSWGSMQARSLIRRAWFIALSSVVTTELLDRGIPEDRIFRIPGGVDLRSFHPADLEEKHALRASLGLGPEPIIISTSRLVPVKQLDIAIRAMEEVEKAQLLILGGGSERSHLEELAAQLPDPGRVRFAGTKENVQDYLRAADIFVLPSSSEGLSNSLLEAMACGLACVVSRIAGVPELFTEESGIVLDTNDPRSWAQEISALVEKPSMRAQMGESAARRIADRFTLEQTADRTVQAYRRILDARS